MGVGIPSFATDRSTNRVRFNLDKTLCWGKRFPQLWVISIINVIHRSVCLSSSVRLGLIWWSHEWIRVMFLSHSNSIRVSWLPKLSIVSIVDIIHCTVGVPTSVWLILVRRSYKWIWVLRKSLIVSNLDGWRRIVNIFRHCSLVISVSVRSHFVDRDIVIRNICWSRLRHINWCYLSKSRAIVRFV